MWCPYCDANIRHEASVHENWDEPSFEMDCPECGKLMEVTVEVAEYDYSATGIEHERIDDATTS